MTEASQSVPQLWLETEAGGFHLATMAYGPGRVPHVRLSVHPDFLSSSLALTNFMRLSLMKAASASVGGAPCRKSGTMGRKRILPMLSFHGQGLLLLAAVPSPHCKSVRR